MTKVAYGIYLNTPATGVIHAADCVIEEQNGKPRRIGFRYRAEYLNHSAAFPLDPHPLPLTENEIVLNCDLGLPGFLDDYLPDAKPKVAQCAEQVITALEEWENIAQAEGVSEQETLLVRKYFNV